MLRMGQEGPHRYLQHLSASPERLSFLSAIIDVSHALGERYTVEES